MIDEYSKFRGTLYNVQGGKSGTGVSFSDVAGVEHAMELVEETIEMLLGDERYQEMGAKAPRVCHELTATVLALLDKGAFLFFWWIGHVALRSESSWHPLE